MKIIASHLLWQYSVALLSFKPPGFEPDAGSPSVLAQVPVEIATMYPPGTPLPRKYTTPRVEQGGTSQVFLDRTKLHRSGWAWNPLLGKWASTVAGLLSSS